jgi:hypothetical protein
MSHSEIRKSLASLSLAAALSLGSASYAQEQSPAPSQSSASHPATDSGARSKDVSGQMLVGTKVKMPGGDYLGEVSAVVGDQRGYARYAIVSHGGIMGLRVKRTAIPWVTVESFMYEGKLIMNRLQLERAPVLSGDTAPTISSGSWSREADGYWSGTIIDRARTGG